MKQARTKTQALLTALDYPGEILTGVPVVEVKGMAEAVILNHRGVIGYDGGAVRVASAIGPLTVSGEGLQICRMNRERIVVRGRISAVTMEERPC